MEKKGTSFKVNFARRGKKSSFLEKGGLEKEQKGSSS